MPSFPKSGQPESPPKRGFDAPCLKCNETDCVSIDLADLKTFRCTNCEEEFTVDDISQIVNKWFPILSWIETAPVKED